MNAQTLSQIIPAAGGRDQDEMLRLIHELESIEDLFVGFLYGHGNDNRFLYLSQAIESITGYSPATFLSDTGYSLFYSITPLAYRAHVIERAAFYIREAKEKDFPLAATRLMEMNGGLNHKNGSVSKVRYLGVVLEYTSGHDILFSLCTWQKVDLVPEEKLAAIKADVYRYMTAFKEIYVRLHRDRYNHDGYVKADATRIVYPLYKGPAVTKKEYEVLQLISNGYSSKKIAEHLHISFHTAESHRKNLLEKFEAVNTAELMKKASKVFWFE